VYHSNLSVMSSNRYTSISCFHDATAPPPPSGPGLSHCRGFTIILRHTTLGRSPLDGRSAPQTTTGTDIILIMYSYCYCLCILIVMYCLFILIMYCLCILIVMYVLFCIFCFHRANWHSSANLTEVFPCFFLSCKANARVKLVKTGHGPHSS
jgi:Flp pilus assembly protein TadB